MIHLNRIAGTVFCRAITGRDLSRVLVPAIMLLAAACAAQVQMRPARLVPYSGIQPATVILDRPVEGSSTAGYSRRLPRHSKWAEIGAVSQGTVYKPRDITLTVEGAHVREAYIVVRNGTWVGFWLPVEEAFSPLGEPVKVILRGSRNR